MASDVVEFQIQTFLTTFEKVKPILPDTLVSEFEQIKKCIVDADQVKRNVGSNPRAFSSLLPLLNDLNDALAECTVMGEQSQNVSEGFSTCYYIPFLQPVFIRNMKQKLKSNKYQLSEFSSSPSSNTLFPTTRFTSFESNPDFQLVGFDEQERKIRDLICENSYKAIGVYGMAGSGKSALILTVLNNPSVRNQFSPIIWLCLSDIHSTDQEDPEHFELSIVKFILCELGCDVDKWTILNPSKADLLKHLKELLMSKKYLIVFDDVWENNEFYANLGDAQPQPQPGSDIILKNPLSEALPRDSGGKIIITSRQKEVVKNMVDEKNLIPMKPLSRESCRMILEDEIGFGGYAKKIEDLLNGSEVVSIGIHGPSSSANNDVVRKVLDSPSVREKFQPIIWVPVSLIFFNYGEITENNDLIKVGDEIMKHVLKGLGCDIDELTKNESHLELAEIVRQSLLGFKKYLIVLADVHENYDFWGGMMSSTWWPTDGDGTIIATSRIKGLSEYVVMGDQNLVHVRLPELASNEASEIVKDRHSQKLFWKKVVTPETN